jgi:hypothetical protein
MRFHDPHASQRIVSRFDVVSVAVMTGTVFKPRT